MELLRRFSRDSVEISVEKGGDGVSDTDETGELSHLLALQGEEVQTYGEGNGPAMQSGALNRGGSGWEGAV